MRCGELRRADPRRERRRLPGAASLSAPQGRSLARNAAAALGFQLLLVLVNLGATAVLVRTLGASRFGGWSLLGVVFAYGALLDLGLGTSLVRRAAAAHAADDHPALASALGTTLVATLILGVAGAAVLAICAAPLAGALNVPAAWRAEFVAATRVTAVGIAFAVPGAALGAVPTALQRLDRLLRVEAIATAATVLAQIVAALSGAGLVALAALGAGGRLASLLLRYALMRRLLPDLHLRFDPRYPFWAELGRFGALKVLQQIASQVVLHVDRLLVAVLVSAPAVALYAVPLELAQKLLFVPSFVGMAYYPAASALAGSGSRSAFAGAYERTSRAVALATLPMAAIIAALAAPLLAVFAGPSFVASAGLLRVLAFAYAGMALTAIPSLAADALNRPEIPARFSLLAVALNLSLSLLLIPRFGVLGAGLALLGNVVLLMPWFIVSVTRRVVGVSARSYFMRAIGAPALPTAACAGVLAAAVIGGAAGPAGLGAALAGAVLAFALVLRFSRMLGADDRRALGELPAGRWLQWLAAK